MNDRLFEDQDFGYVPTEMDLIPSFQMAQSSIISVNRPIGALYLVITV